MKKALKILFPLLILLIASVTFLTGTDWDMETVLWNTQATSVTIISDGSDTSDVFEILTYDYGRKYPDALNFHSTSTEGANSDSCNNKLSLQLSMDQTFWFDYGGIDTLKSTTTAATIVVGAKRITGAELFGAWYGRVIVKGITTGTDTSVVTLKFSRIITK